MPTSENFQLQPALLQHLNLALKALLELGPASSMLYATYRLGLVTGHLRRVTPVRRWATQASDKLRTDLLPLPPRDDLQATLGDDGLKILFEEADEIVSGNVRLFGGPPVPLRLTLPVQLKHWSTYDSGTLDGQDIKFLWEPGRFGWAYTLGRAYHLSQDEHYAQAFWRNTHTFLEANPPNLGPHWASAQEVGLRLIAFVFAAQVFSASPHSTPQQMSLLAAAIAAHAERIPSTLLYARAQNNNHLISEALGLYTAAAALPEHTSAAKWQRLGWHWLNRAFQTQISAPGAYIQHSANYHRLMLQAAMWAAAIQRRAFQEQPYPPATLTRLQAATQWLFRLLDPICGQVPNLGSNDGAYILPLTSCSFQDYRPVLQASARVFLGESILPASVWDEMALWLGCSGPEPPSNSAPPKATEPHVLHASNSWAYLRIAHFDSRPGHADQLHLDLWWRGINLAQDAGTYLYNAPPPWDNALTHTAVHNTVMLDGQEQMRRAGRFLYLDWAQGRVVAQEKKAPDGTWERLSACHDGYRRQGITHQRTVTAWQDNRWIIQDLFEGKQDDRVHLFRLHWLLPDWPHKLRYISTPGQGSGIELSLLSPYGWVSLSISTIGQVGNPLHFTLTRAGELVSGEPPIHPTWGWTSHTYGDKIPALSFGITLQAGLPLTLESRWDLFGENKPSG